MQGNGDYISREAFKQEVIRLSTHPLNEWDTLGVLAAADRIPAADVRPVVRGNWIGIDDFPHEDWECDNCGCVVEGSDDPWNYWHFCPNCGAYMRQEASDG